MSDIKNDEWPNDNGSINVSQINGPKNKYGYCPAIVSFVHPLGDRLVVTISNYNKWFPSLHKTCQEGKWRNVRNQGVREKMGFLDAVNKTMEEHQEQEKRRKEIETAAAMQELQEKRAAEKFERDNMGEPE